MKYVLIIPCVLWYGYLCAQDTNSNKNHPPSTQIEVQIKDGKSFENAVIIRAKTEANSTAQKIEFIKTHYSDYRPLKKTVIYQKGKPYEMVTIINAKKEQIKLYFDISSYFGKPKSR